MKNNLDYVKERVQRFFEISSLKCACCGELGEALVKEGDLEFVITPEFYGIYNLKGWEKVMDEESLWVIENMESVLKILPHLEKNWKLTCQATRELILTAQNAKEF